MKLDLSKDDAGPAMENVGTLIHCAGAPKGDDTLARKLVADAGRAGVEHFVFMSVVGCDRVPVTSWFDRAAFGYFAAKAEAEQVIAQSGIPWTTLRATQFAQSLANVADAMTKLPIVPYAAGFTFQPSDVEQVAARLVELALGPPAGRVRDVAGPEMLDMKSLLKSYCHARDRHRPMVPLWLPGRAAAACRVGANLPVDADLIGSGWSALVAHLATADRQ